MSAPTPRFARTRLSADDSISKIRDAVKKYGVRHFSQSYEDGRPVGVNIVAVSDALGEIPIMLKVNAKALRDRLYGENSTTSPADQLERAYDVGWRQLLAYVEVALELVESGERTIEEAFMADVGVKTDDGFRRLADVYRDTGGRLALPSGPTDAIDADYEEVD